MNRFKITAAAVAVMMLTGCALKPEPLTYQERQDYLQKDLDLREAFMIPVARPISMSEAMVRTVRANIEHRLQMMERALSEEEFEQAKLAMLPELNGTASIAHRTPQSASKSINLDTGEVSTGGYTSSEEKTHALGDITFSWNLLDLGLSYYQAKQQADAVMVRREMERSVTHKLLNKVRNVYWRAYYAQLFTPKIEAFLEKSHKTLADLQKAQDQRLLSPLEALQYRRGLLSVVSQMESIHSEMVTAKVELRSLMNLPANQEFELIAPANPLKAVDVKMPEFEQMLEVALDLRPECRQEMYRSRASLAEVKKAYLKALPGLEVKAAWNFDTNTYLRDGNWASLWGTTTANVIDMLTTPQRVSLARRNVEVADYRRLGVHLAVIMQVQMAAEELKNAVKASDRSIQMHDIDTQLTKLVDNKVTAQRGNPLELMKQEASALLSELNTYKSMAQVQNAYGQLLNSMGVDTVEQAAFGEGTLEEVTAKLEGMNSFDALDVKTIVTAETARMAEEKRLAELEAQARKARTVQQGDVWTAMTPD